MGILDDTRNYLAHEIKKIKKQARMRKALKFELGALVTAEVSLETPHITRDKQYSVLVVSPVYFSNGVGKPKLEDVVFRFIDDKTTTQQLSYSNFRY